jgi:hypothetical protein
VLEAKTDRRGQQAVSPTALSRPSREGAGERAISPRLAPSLTLAGGALVALGGIGTWIRATNLPAGTFTPEQVAVVNGGSESGGWILLVIGVLTVAAAFAWRAGAPRVRAVAPGVSVLAAVLASVRLALLDRRAAEMAEEAAQTGGTEAYHAGYGWGAWLLLVGVLLMGLGILAGGLRELDLRRGR